MMSHFCPIKILPQPLIKPSFIVIFPKSVSISYYCSYPPFFLLTAFRAVKKQKNININSRGFDIMACRTITAHLHPKLYF